MDIGRRTKPTQLCRNRAEEADCPADGQSHPLNGISPGTGHGLLPDTLRAELWVKAGAEIVEVTDTEFGTALQAIGTKHSARRDGSGARDDRDAAGQTRQTSSKADGSFDLTEIPPGHYELGVMARGFQGYRQAVDLSLRDMAMMDAPLIVGSAAQTVTVEAESSVLETSSASVAAVQVTELPSRIAAQMSVTLGKRVLSLDGGGALFVSRNRAKSWKRVKPQWAGMVTLIGTANSSATQGKRGKTIEENAPTVFQLTTDTGAVWVSEDGTHWRER